MTTLQLGRRLIGAGQPTFVIAELSGNHGHDYDRAARIIDAAAAAGADAIKLQTYTPDTITIDSDLPAFRITTGTAWAGKTLHQLYAEAMTPWPWHARLQQVARDCGLELFSSPFDQTAVELLASLDVPAYKVASFELIDLPLVAAIASQGKPVIASTGMANLAEIHDAVETIRRAGAPGLALLHCVSAYPAAPAEMNLATIPHLAAAFGCVVGLSDHTLSDTSAILAVGLGAKIIEKHVTLRRADGGPDAHFSLEPPELARMIAAVREAEAAVGAPSYARTAGEAANETFRRSLYVVADVRAGELLTAANVRSIRPGGGLPPRWLPVVLGRRARVDLARGTALTWDHV